MWAVFFPPFSCAFFYWACSFLLSSFSSSCSLTLFSSPLWYLDMISHSLIGLYLCWQTHFFWYQINRGIQSKCLWYANWDKTGYAEPEKTQSRKSTQKFPSAHPLCRDWSKVKKCKATCWQRFSTASVVWT